MSRHRFLPGGTKPMKALVLPVVLLVTGVVAAQSEAPRWLKGNLHTHSLWSDGNDFPEVIARWYKDQGYDFLALSDHNILSDHEKWMAVDTVVRRGGRLALQRYREQFGADWVETREVEGKLEVRLRRLDEFAPLLEEPGSFLMIQAEEVTSSFQRLPVHLNATNLQDLVRPRRGGSVRHTIAENLDAIAEQGRRQDEPLLGHLNHPNFGYAVTAEDLAAVLQERFFEVWNGHNSVRHTGDSLHASVEQLWDIANTLRIARFQAPPLFGLGTDDSHHYFVTSPNRSNSGRGWVMVRAIRLDAASIVRALQAGDFYASSGVTLSEVDFADGILEVRIEPVRGESYVTRFVGTREGFDPTFQPVRNAEGEPVRATYRYSSDVGEVLAEVKGTRARYRLRGDELYVRAVVTSSAPPARPVYDGQLQHAWTQPVGWRHRVLPDEAPRLGPAVCGATADKHLQGITTDHVGSVFWSFTDRLMKTDGAGEVKAEVAVQDHHGDLTFWQGELYVAVNLGVFNRMTGADSWVYVYGTEDLELRRKHRLPEVVHGAGGIACRGGSFFVVGGLPEGADGNLVYEYDAGFDHLETHLLPGGPTEMGIQTAEFADNRFWFGCYGEPRRLLVADMSLRNVQAAEFDCAYGVTEIPGGRFLVARSDRTASGSWSGRLILALPDPETGLRLPD